MSRLFVLFLLCIHLFASQEGGPYIGIGYGKSWMQDKGYFDLEEKQSRLFAAYTGAYINENLSVEVEYVGGIEFSKSSKANQKFSLLEINTQAHYPFWQKKADMFVKFGTGKVQTKHNAGVAFVFGAGAIYRFSKRYALKAAYDYLYFGVDTDADEVKEIDIHAHIVYGALEVQF